MRCQETGTARRDESTYHDLINRIRATCRHRGDLESREFEFNVSGEVMS